MSDEVWYKDGLQFTCTQCGNCCTGAPGVVWVDEAEIEAIAEFLGKSIGEVQLHHCRLTRGRTTLAEYANGDCIFFDTESRRCKIYPARPKQCRTWPFWNSNLESPRNWADIQTDCPGAGKGDFFSLEEIRERANLIDL
ncbi:MAG: hypothetical protein CMJ78_04670 [Planctomycetaceae bacterium]|nr:hypothetical protein [Planctomycetaceae bacterium]